MEEISKVSDLVRQLLTENKELGGNMPQLCLFVWHRQNAKLSSMSFSAFAAEYVKKENSIFSDAEAIGRARRKLQKDHPHLRDSGWKARQRKQLETIADINSIE